MNEFSEVAIDDDLIKKNIETQSDDEEAQNDYDDTMNDSVTKHSCDSKLMVRNETQKEEVLSAYS